MRLRFRLLFLMISSFWKKPIGILDEFVLNLRVFPNDIDITKISNDRYLEMNRVRPYILHNVKCKA